MLGIESFPADESGFEALLGWIASHGEIQVVGLEGTGSWGVGLSRFLHDHEILVVEVRASPYVLQFAASRSAH